MNLCFKLIVPQHFAKTRIYANRTYRAADFRTGSILFWLHPRPFISGGFVDDGGFHGALAVLGSSYSGGEGVSIAAADVKANSANAIFSGKNCSLISNADLIAHNALTINADSRSFARGDVQLGSDLGIVSLFLTQISSVAGGEFGTDVRNSNGRKIKGKSISMNNNYTARARSMSAQSSKGLSANVISGGANIALANTTVDATAGISGGDAEGDSTSEDGDVSITVTGNANAEASFYAPVKSLAGAELAVNFVEARLLGSQDAYIENASASANNISVVSRFNESDTGIGASAIIAGGS